MYMRVLLWIGIAVALLLAVSLLYSFRFKNIETPSYNVLKKLGEIEIRQYPTMILAQTKLKSGRYDGNEDNGFRTVAGYIFGGNQAQQKIAMTAPVIMNMSDSNASMSFVMPSQYQMEELPTPNSNKVQITQQAPLVLAVIRFGGFASQNKIHEQADLLTQTLKENNIQIKGPLLFMGYNAPWDVTWRRNEVAYEIEGFTP